MDRASNNIREQPHPQLTDIHHVLRAAGHGPRYALSTRGPCSDRDETTEHRRTLEPGDPGDSDEVQHC